MKKSFLLLFLLLPISCLANNISIGKTELDIPAPTGFAAVTPKMGSLYNLQKQFVAQTNVQYMNFIPVSSVPIALADEIPDLNRTFSVQTAKTLVDRSVSSADFSKLKHIIKTQNDEIKKEVEKKLPDIMEKINEGITSEYDVDLALGVSQIIPFSPHHETERILAYSSYVKYDMTDENGNPAPFVVAMTATFAHVKGKVLFLYSYAEEDALEWSRDASKSWAESIVVANPSDLQALTTESLPSGMTQIDWERVAVKAIIGAIIGLIIGLIVWARKRHKSS